MKMFKFLALALVTIGLTAAAPASAATAMTSNFVRNATIGNGFEIMSSRIALQRSHNPEVRDFAQRMIDDHRKADEDLRNTVMASHTRIRGMPNNLDASHRQMLSRLERASGPAFDRRYIEMQASAHDQALRLFSSYAHRGDNPALRDFAAHTLPALQEHQDHVRHIRLAR